MKAYLRKHRYNMPPEGYPEINCRQCNTTFTPRTRNSAFCCRNCKDVYNRAYKYDYNYKRRQRSLTPRAFLSNLLGYKRRKETLTIECLMSLYEKQEGKCALTGVPMTYEQGKGKLRTNISIDRIDSKRGYDNTNIRLVCTMVNKMRQDMDDTDFMAWCKLVLEPLK